MTEPLPELLDNRALRTELGVTSTPSWDGSDDELLNAEQAAALLTVKPSTLRAWAREGRVQQLAMEQDGFFFFFFFFFFFLGDGFVVYLAPVKLLLQGGKRGYLERAVWRFSVKPSRVGGGCDTSRHAASGQRRVPYRGLDRRPLRSRLMMTGARSGAGCRGRSAWAAAGTVTGPPSACASASPWAPAFGFRDVVVAGAGRVRQGLARAQRQAAA